jgi:CelD/BcsL family acetyltransferase involved in cellulose biosynthesis
MSFTCEVTDPASLGRTERARWHVIRQAVPALANPYFAYGFTAVVAAARTDVRVAVLRDSGSLTAFFPFQRDKLGSGRPVGGKISDFHGLIAGLETRYDARALLRASGLRSYTFDHLIPMQETFRPFIRALDISPYLDLAAGYPAYREAVRGAGLGGPREAEMKLRRIERRIGEVRFTFHDADPAVLRTLLRWKSLQFRRTHGFDPLSRRWVTEVLERVHATQTADFAGVLSALYADERLIAAHLGMRSGATLHSWFPAYDSSIAKYSPGLVLLLKLAEAAAERGVEVLDLGKGPESYKRRFTTEGVPLAIGSVERGSLEGAAARISRASWGAVLRSPLYGRAHRLRRQLQFR